MSLIDFVRESNKIEGILREPTDAEVTMLGTFIFKSKITIDDLQDFVEVYQPNAVLRRRAGLDVRVGTHYPPKGGPEIVTELTRILQNAGVEPAYCTHHYYETLHPFTDGNGRSGRALWLWRMRVGGELDRALILGFLHSWYYQSLQHGHTA